MSFRDYKMDWQSTANSSVETSSSVGTSSSAWGVNTGWGTSSNWVHLIGKIGIPEVAFETARGKWLQATISTATRDRRKDAIVCIFSEQVWEESGAEVGSVVEIFGAFHSRNVFSNGKRHLKLFVSTREMRLGFGDCNEVRLVGYVCKDPVYRKTPRGLKITDLLLAVNRRTGKSDYLPCISKERVARSLSNAKVGDKITAIGEIHSRNYQKKTEDGIETRTAWEVCINSYAEVEQGEN